MDSRGGGGGRVERERERERERTGRGETNTCITIILFSLSAESPASFSSHCFFPSIFLLLLSYPVNFNEVLCF